MDVLETSALVTGKDVNSGDASSATAATTTTATTTNTKSNANGEKQQHLYKVLVIGDYAVG
jgi:hypothetical protein